MVTLNVVDLRRKLEVVPKDGLALHTERDQGYRLVFDDPQRVYVYRSLKLRAALHRAWFGEHRFELSQSETAIVELLMKSPDVAVTRATITERVGLDGRSLEGAMQKLNRLLRTETKDAFGVLGGHTATGSSSIGSRAGGSRSPSSTPSCPGATRRSR